MKPAATASITLDGASAPDLTLSPGGPPATDAYGDKGYDYQFNFSGTQTFTVTNNGIGNVSLSPFFDLDPAFSVANDTCVTNPGLVSLPPNGTCSFDVTFNTSQCTQEVASGSIEFNPADYGILLQLTGACS
jgi:hypothetical protein